MSTVETTNVPADRDRRGPVDKHARIRDVDHARRLEREKQTLERQKEKEPAKTAIDPVEEYKRLMELRSGGRYVPPAKLRALQQQMNLSKQSKEYQRIQWDQLKKSINSLINKVSKSNIRDIVGDIFSQNLVRGRGLFVRSIMKAQSSSIVYTSVYAALVAIINSKLPQIGELLITRLIIQFRRAFKRNDKPACLSATMFLAHLCNHQVAHEILCLEILHLLLKNPTNDTVEIAVGFTREVGSYLSEVSMEATNGAFEMFRAILQEGELENRIQYMIEVLFQIRRDGFVNNPRVSQDLDLVEEEDQITHMIGLTDELKSQDILNVFKFDENYEENEQKYVQISKEILDSDSEQESGSESEQEDEEGGEEPIKTTNGVEIKDMTGTELVNLRKTVYFIIKSSMISKEIAHKLSKFELPHDEQKREVAIMIIECCAQEKIYDTIYGSVVGILCEEPRYRLWYDLFKDAFKHYYEIIHRYDSNQIRNIATLFGFVLGTDRLGWDVFECVHMTEEASTSSSRIFIKLLFQEMQQLLGIPKLAKRFKEDNYLKPYLTNMFVKGTAEDTRFAINYFTAIGLGVLTEDMREYLKSLPPPSPKNYSDRDSYSRSRSRSVSSYDSRSDRSSYSESGRSISPNRNRADRNMGRRRSYSGSPRSDRNGSDYDRGRSRRGGSISSRGSSYSRSASPDEFGRQKPRSRRSPSPTRDRSKSPPRQYTPPPERPSTWADVKKRDRSNSIDRTRKRRAQASDYL